jgi:hypothetical protein
MAVTLTLADDTFQKTWDGCVVSSPHGTIFHTWQWLRLIEKQSSTKLLPILIYKGTVLIALYPVFLQKRYFYTLALSPPFGAYMVYLGPVIINYESSKQDTRENLFIQIQQEVDKYIFGKNKCAFSLIRTSPGLSDPRPLRWAGYHIDPLFTYRIPLHEGTDVVWEKLEKKLRVNIKKAVKEGVTVRLGDWEDLEFIHDSLSKTIPDFSVNDYKKYLLGIYQKCYPDTLKIFVAEYQGERAGGVITLCYKDIMYHWLGSPKSFLVNISPNDLVQWEAIKWGIEHGYTYIDIMDSGENPRLRQFKAKWNPDLVNWYSATKDSSFFYLLGKNLLKMVQRKI